MPALCAAWASSFVWLLSVLHGPRFLLLQGWSPQAPDMPMVVAIHNSVNERAWSEVSHKRVLLLSFLVHMLVRRAGSLCCAL